MKLRPSAMLLLAAALSGAALLAGPTAEARPKPPILITPPPLPPPMPDVGLAASFARDAAAYQGYVREASAISPAFVDAAGVASSLSTGVAYQPDQLRRGAVAYGAIAALGDMTFVKAVRAAGATPDDRYAIVRKIYADPANVLSFPGALEAAGLAKAALAAGGMSLFEDGDRVRQAAYDIQHQPWSLAEVEGRDARAQSVKTLSHSDRPVSPADEASINQQIAAEANGLAADPVAAPPPYSHLVVNAVALAALAAVGEAGDADASHLGWLSDDYYLDHCLAEAKLALYECLAVAGPNYEDVFCLGQHALKDTGACLVRGAGSTVPLQVYTVAIRTPPLPRHLRHEVRRERRRPRRR